ncbi:pyridoxal-phosphate dependent enzyme [Promethearchaeum syntrophicum]|uniref:Pyridoxal-phosphate dependent enzyme n=1 Tax=Promethearchaeum syntrophicum TaxID=2594042 RepID=A0A5B9DB77_9ARCH|nr:pyridoxal-phosphate dependent enzyme [Candidatus Prometheoarchaeum syntrophicum]QEE16251.1 Threonine synthase [Candidatus Prometheoarchaeum syntrophicum]
MELQWVKKPTCNECGQEFNEPFLWCPHCNNLISIQPIKGPQKSKINLKSMWSLNPFLPKFSEIASLVEGNTPIIQIRNIPEIKDVNIKLEFRNPTSSFRDRASSLIVSDALSKKSKEIIGASTGSFSISLAAYASQAALKSTTFIPGNLDLSKIEQLKMYGTKIIDTNKNLDEAIKSAKNYTLEKKGYFPIPNDNLLTIEGQKTIGLELILQLKDIDNVIIPRGSGTLLLSIYRGFEDAIESGWISKFPKIFAVSLKSSSSSHFAESLEMKAPPLINQIKKIIKKTHGKEISIDALDMIKDASEVAMKEGLFIEPASASVISAAKNLTPKDINPQKTVAILTGSGLNALNKFAFRMRNLKKTVWGLSETSTRRFEILNIIAENKNTTHGYAIWASLGKKKTIQSIYHHLDSLNQDGLIKFQEVGNTKKCIITNKGIDILNKMREIIDLREI